MFITESKISNNVYLAKEQIGNRWLKFRTNEDVGYGDFPELITFNEVTKEIKIQPFYGSECFEFLGVFQSKDLAIRGSI